MQKFISVIRKHVKASSDDNDDDYIIMLLILLAGGPSPLYVAFITIKILCIDNKIVHILHNHTHYKWSQITVSLLGNIYVINIIVVAGDLISHPHTQSLP